MKNLSEVIERNLPIAPEPDQLRAWASNPATSWFMQKNLTLVHQQTLERLAAVRHQDSYDELRDFYKLQACAELLEQIINEIEGLKDE